MEATLAVLNSLIGNGIIEGYAIGGAVGAIFWDEPFDTIDLDVFVILPESAPPLDPLRGVISHLKNHGFDFEGEFLVVEGVPVQFLPADDSEGLLREALAAAAEVEYQGSAGPVMTRVITPEYLAAIALKVHRSKDYERAFRLLTGPRVDRKRVGDLVERFGLQEFWSVLLRRYPELA